jgi:hypothetical protein
MPQQSKQMETIMGDGNDRSERISRRMVIARTAFALGGVAAAAAVTPALAQQKVSQESAKYQTTPKGQQNCSMCASFQAPNACKLVDGTISPSGWCLLFAPKT